MSGYLSGTLAILCINLIFAYGIFVTAAAGQINLGGAGFQAIGAYATAWLASQPGVPMWYHHPGRNADHRAGRLSHFVSGAAYARRLHGARHLRVRRGGIAAFCCAPACSAARWAWWCRSTSSCGC